LLARLDHVLHSLFGMGPLELPPPQSRSDARHQQGGAQQAPPHGRKKAMTRAAGQVLGLGILGAHGCNADSTDNDIMKLWIVLAFVGIVGSLLAAGFFMVRGGPAEQDKAQRMANALAWRIGLSVALFVCLILAYAMGWIKPTGIPIGA
jgi:hypothetical protein